MIFAILTVAASLQLSTPPYFVAPSQLPPTLNTPNLYRDYRGLNLFRKPVACGDIHRDVVEHQKEQLRKLGRLPNGAAQYAVERTVGGCGVPTPVGYHPDYLLPGAADAPAMREDGPSNKH